MQPVVEARGLIIQTVCDVVKPCQDGIKHAELKQLRFWFCFLHKTTIFGWDWIGFSLKWVMTGTTRCGAFGKGTDSDNVSFFLFRLFSSLSNDQAPPPAQEATKTCRQYCGFETSD